MCLSKNVEEKQKGRRSETPEQWAHWCEPWIQVWRTLRGRKTLMWPDSAVQDSSIGDIVTQWFSESSSDFSVFKALQSCRRHMWTLWRRQRHEQRQRRWERFIIFYEIEVILSWHWGLVTDTQRVTWTAFAIPAMLFFKNLSRPKITLIRDLCVMFWIWCNRVYQRDGPS